MLPGRSRGQALVEFGLLTPFLLLIVFITIDIGRLLYAWAAISSAAREGARIVSLQPDATTDCFALQRMESVGQGFNLTVDPASLAGNTDPNNPGPPYQPTTPPPAVGYVYIWPAVAVADPPDSGTNCLGSQRQISQTVRHVAVEIQYNFVPLTPLVAQLNRGFVIRTISVVEVEY